jgi:hypothetical protein
LALAKCISNYKFEKALRTFPKVFKKERRCCMNDEVLYPELVDYIYDFQVKFMTEDERLASGKIIFSSKDPGEMMIEAKKIKKEIIEGEIRKQMLANGFDVFKNRVATRIYLRHKHELELNCCPKCGKIARTPLSKQCRFCFHSWH